MRKVYSSLSAPQTTEALGLAVTGIEILTRSFTLEGFEEYLVSHAVFNPTLSQPNCTAKMLQTNSILGRILAINALADENPAFKERDFKNIVKNRRNIIQK